MLRDIGSFQLAAAIGALAGVAIVHADDSKSATAVFEVESTAGRVTRITIRRPDGVVYVLDQFVRSTDALSDEAQGLSLSARPQDDPEMDEHEYHRTCAWAENARAFTRGTRLSAGKTVVLWNNPKRALRLNAGANTNSGLRGECLSPDGRYLSIFDGVEGTAMPNLPGIVELDTDLPVVPFIGQHSGKAYGEDRYFDFVGWQPGAPHTLQFNYGGDGQDIDDDALPRASPPKR